MPDQNPDWTEEELALALYAYYELGGDRPSKRHPVIVALSRLLNELPIHASEDRASRFRSPDGVRRRVSYFSQIDRGDVVPGRESYYSVYERYGNHEDELAEAVQRIRDRYNVPTRFLRPTLRPLRQ